MLSRDSAGLKPDSSTANRWRLLRDRGVELDVIVMSREAGEWSENGLRVWSSGGVGLIRRILRCWRQALKCAQIADLITAQDPFELGLLAYAVARKFNKKLELQDHGGFFDGEVADEPFWLLRTQLARWLAQRAQGIRTVSPKSLDNLKTKSLGDKSYWLPIAADERFRAAMCHPEPFNFVSVGRLIPVKRFELLLTAFTLVRKNNPQAKLVIVGDGALKPQLKAKAQALGILNSVEFAGHGDPLPYLERASCFVLLSKHEGWGVAVVEAAMAGVPVVMTDTGCARWLEKLSRARVLISEDPEEISRILEIASTDKRITGTSIEAQSLEAAAHEQAVQWKKTLETKPRTLICAQAVDENDPLFGFFVPWLRKFAEHGDAIVCALRVSDPLPDLPSNIEIRASRLKGSKSRFAVLWNVAKISWQERFCYQSVFIRGDAQYLACLGWLWRLLGKKIVFWYTHYTVKGPWFWLAVPWANDIVTAVPESNPLESALLIGHHLDIEKFKPAVTSPQVHIAPKVLLFGRISPVKRVAWMVRVLTPLLEAGRVDLTVIGKTTDEASRQELKTILPPMAHWEERDVPNREAPEIYKNFDIFINATPGSMDKTILEAAASGLVVMAATKGLARGLFEGLYWLRFGNEEEFTEALDKILAMSAEQRKTVSLQLREWVMRQHSMDSHLVKLSALLHEARPKRPLKQAVKLGLHKLSLRRFSQGVPVIMFHSFDNRGSAGWDKARLTAWLIRAMSAGYIFQDFSGILSCIHDKSLKTKNILATIDDATEDLLDVLDVFKMFAIKPLVFAPGLIKEIKSSDGWVRQVVPLDKLATLAQEKILELGAHGQTHTNLTELEPQDLEDEIKGSYADIKALQPSTAPLAFAYPRGKVNQEVISVVRTAGFAGAFTVKPGIWSAVSDYYAIPRIPVLWWMSSKDLTTLIK
ncbi:MAG: glycosyltransferase [Patescibacteria group bacterium]